MTDVCMKMCSEPIVWHPGHLHAHVRHTGRGTFTCTSCVHINVHWCDCPMCSCKWGVSHVTEMCMKYAVSQVYDSLHIYMHTSDTRVTALYMQLMRACKSAVIRLSDVFVNWGVRPMNDVCMKMSSEPVVWLSAHLHAHVSHSGHCTFTCTWCVLVNVQLSDCLIRSCRWAVGQMTDVCMKMCSGPIIWRPAHLHAHVRHTGRCTFTCTWCVHINVHWCDCPICSCKWGVRHVTEMWMKYAVSQVYDSLHIYMNTSDTCVTALYMQLMRACKCAVITLSDVFVNWAVRPMTDVCMKMCSEQLSYSLHIYMHTSVTRVTAHFHAPNVCL